MEGNNINLVGSVMAIEGDFKLSGITLNYNGAGGIQFSGYRKLGRESVPIRIVMDKSQVDLINNCQGVMEIYECYKEMDYFPE